MTLLGLGAHAPAGLPLAIGDPARYICTDATPMDPSWKSTTEATRVLGVTLASLYRLIDSGALRAYRFGRVIRIKTADLDAYIATTRDQHHRSTRFTIPKEADRQDEREQTDS